MSQENVELVYRACEAVNRRDAGALLALMDDDVEADPRMVAIEGSFHGHDGIRLWWKNLLDVFPDFAIEVVEVRDFGDLTVAALRTRGHGAGSDVPLDTATWHVARWRGGKCIWWRNFDSRTEALEAVGLPE